ncbi:outer membrane beta-barrel protein [Sphingobium aromaticiconvertens]|uniref:outer membrane beta-barrel protein n=1 Tax=Sphingobium aromaticiconvertens TaxID=365341 RepID=UPI00301A8E12
MRARNRLLTSCVSLCVAIPFATPALAQQTDRPASVLDLVAQEYQPIGIRLGNIRIDPELDARIEYDSNIYAEATDKDDDWKTVISPRLTGTYDAGTVKMTARAAGTFRRFFSFKRENSSAGLADLKLGWQPNEGTSIQGTGGWERAIEDRGDPEARNFQTIGPRRIDVLHGTLNVAHEMGRLGFDAEAAARRLDHVSSIDAERDHAVYSGSARLRYRLSGLVSIFGQGFVNRRDFRLATDTSGINRDATTYGGRGGVAIDPGGTLRGDFGVGVFRFDPSDPTLKGRTGLSVEGSMTFQPTQRIAFTLDAFQGDVATLRAGAIARTDSRLQIGMQSEARHNLRWSLAAFYRRTNFVGTPVKERTIGGLFEAEYLINRLFSVAATVRYGDRSSDDPTESYTRLRGGVELRVRF